MLRKVSSAEDCVLDLNDIFDVKANEMASKNVDAMASPKSISIETVSS